MRTCAIPEQGRYTRKAEPGQFQCVNRVGEIGHVPIFGNRCDFAIVLSHRKVKGRFETIIGKGGKIRKAAQAVPIEK